MLPITEADLKRGVEDYLNIGQNQGKWVYLRLNSGDFIEVRGNTRRRIKGCPKGTADFVVMGKRTFQFSYAIRPAEDNFTTAWLPYCQVTFLELKSTKGRQTQEQRDFQEMVGKQECQYHIIRSLDELIKVLGED